MAKKKFSELPEATEIVAGDKFLVGRGDVGYSLDASYFSGAESFLELNDTPADYTGHSGKVATVNEAEDGLEFTTISINPDLRVPGRTQSLDFTVSIDDLGQFIEIVNPITITIPTEAFEDLGDGFIISGFNHSSENVDFTTTGVTLAVNADLSPLVPPNGCFSLMKSRAGTNIWILYGYLVLSA